MNVLSMAWYIRVIKIPTPPLSDPYGVCDWGRIILMWARDFF